MELLKAKQEEDRQRLEEQFRADMEAQRVQMQNMMTANMEAQRAFLSAVSAERQKSWNKAVANYEEVLREIYKTKWRKHINKEKLRMLLFECHFHCAVALHNLQSYQKALRHYQRAIEVVSWRKDECQAGCITGRVLHLHVPTLAKIACCHIHTGELNEALNSIDKAILLDFRNPDLFCVRSLVSFLLKQQDKALSDASFAIQLSPTQVCGWLLRGLFKKIKREETPLKISKQERDLQKVRNEIYFNNTQYRRAILKEAIIVFHSQ